MAYPPKKMPMAQAIPFYGRCLKIGTTAIRKNAHPMGLKDSRQMDVDTRTCGKGN
jgi:hypothetical protein